MYAALPYAFAQVLIEVIRPCICRLKPADCMPRLVGLLYVCAGQQPLTSTCQPSCRSLILLWCSLQIPYILVQSVIFTVLVYAMIKFEVKLCFVLTKTLEAKTVFTFDGHDVRRVFFALQWTAAKFFWFLFFEILSLTLFTLYGIASVALTPNVVVASIVSGEWVVMPEHSHRACL